MMLFNHKEAINFCYILHCINIKNLFILLILSKRSQTQKVVYYVIHVYEMFKMDKLRENTEIIV